MKTLITCQKELLDAFLSIPSGEYEEHDYEGDLLHVFFACDVIHADDESVVIESCNDFGPARAMSIEIAYPFVFESMLRLHDAMSGIICDDLDRVGM